MFIIANANANEVFFSNLQSLCGDTFVGEMTYPKEGLDAFSGKRLVATIGTCTSSSIRIPFQVGDDQSRTWVISQTQNGIIFKHEHRHDDGSFDEVSNYGGYADHLGTDLSQAFPADEYTQTLIPAAATNVWSVTLSDDKNQMTYHLKRHDKPRFTAVLRRLVQPN